MEKRKIVFDEPKRLRNLETHRLDFLHLKVHFFATALIRSTKQGRLKAIGSFSNGMIVVIFVTLGTEAISVISMRPASRAERRQYDVHARDPLRHQ